MTSPLRLVEPEQLTGAALLDAVSAFVSRFIVFPHQHCAPMLALAARLALRPGFLVLRALSRDDSAKAKPAVGIKSSRSLQLVLTIKEFHHD